MPKLTEAQRRFLTQRLAMYDTPTEAAEALKEEYGVEISRQLAARHDPTVAQGEGLNAKLKALFHETRERFLRDVEQVPISHRVVRLKELQRLYQGNKRNPTVAAQLLKQAAEEVGNVYSNRREVTGKDGAPVLDLVSACKELFQGATDDEVREMAEEGSTG